MNCPGCGSPNEDRSPACFRCGRALGALTEGTRLGDRYTVQAVLGRGGMGTVYRAWDQVLEEAVALKVLRPELASTEAMERRFRAELKLARRVSHPNVCRIHDYGRDAGVQFISMELVEGTDLRRRLEEQGPIPAEEACRLAAEAAEGLQAIHDVGIVHRDLKTANLMRDGSGRVRVMDFGIAASADQPATPGASYVVGSPEYMSPEQARGLPLDGRSDLYSLGVVLYELLTGRVPFRGENPVATVLQHLHEAPPLDGLPAQDLLRRLLAKKPEDRPATARAVAQELRGSAPQGSPTLVLPRAPARPRPLLLGAAAIAAVMAVGLWLAMRPARDAVVPPPLPTATPTPVAEPSAAEPSPVAAPPALEARATPPPTAAPVALPTTEPPTPSPTPEPLPSVAPSVEPPPTTVPGPGFLRIAVRPWADVVVDGRPIGQTPMAPLSLTPGPHDVELRHPDYRPYRRRTQITSGQTRALVVDLTTDGVRAR